MRYITTVYVNINIQFILLELTNQDTFNIGVALRPRQGQQLSWPLWCLWNSMREYCINLEGRVNDDRPAKICSLY